MSRPGTTDATQTTLPGPEWSAADRGSERSRWLALYVLRGGGEEV
jgi:hypothetical protein